MRLKSFDNSPIPLHMADDQMPLEFFTNFIILAGQAGAFDGDGDEQRRRPITFSRSFKLVETAPLGDIGDQMDVLTGKANKGLRWLIVEMTDTSERGAWAKMKNVSPTFTPIDRTFLDSISISFEIPWPWLEDTTQIVYFDDGTLWSDGAVDVENFTQQVGAGTFSINNAGNDRITRGQITIWGPSTNPKVENTTTGESIQFTGTVPSGTFLLIDLGRQRVTLDGVSNSVWANVVIGDDQTRFFSLVTGNNSIAFTGGGTLYIYWAEVY